MPKPVIALVTDLIFSTKISSTARAISGELHIVRTGDGFAACLADKPDALVIVDMGAEAVDVIAAIRMTRQYEPPPHTIAYLSHVQTDLATAAQQAGADQVMARSAFSTRLQQLLENAQR